jgi:hypothetical protein
MFRRFFIRMRPCNAFSLFCHMPNYEFINFVTDIIQIIRLQVQKSPLFMGNSGKKAKFAKKFLKIITNIY